MRYGVSLAALVVSLMVFGLLPTAFAASNTSLVGEWIDSSGTTFSFDATGANSYTGQVIADPTNTYCVPVDWMVTGTGSHYTGTIALYSPCNPPTGTYVTTGSITIDIAPNGQTAQVTTSYPAGVCFNCSTLTLTRVTEVGIYANFPSAASVETALDDGWPIIANPSATSAPAKCKAPFTGRGSDEPIAQGLAAHKLLTFMTAPWLSFWTVDEPPLKPKKVEPYAEGFAAGKHAASEIAAAALAVPGTPVLPTYVVLDPEGQACGNPLGANKTADWGKLALNKWRELVSGWDHGVETVAGLTPAVYLNKSEYLAKGGKGYPHVFVAIQLPATPGKAVGPNIIGYNAYYGPVTAQGVCGDPTDDIAEVASWKGSFNTLQFGYEKPKGKIKYASKLCPT